MIYLQMLPLHTQLVILKSLIFNQRNSDISLFPGNPFLPLFFACMSNKKLSEFLPSTLNKCVHFASLTKKPFFFSVTVGLCLTVLCRPYCHFYFHVGEMFKCYIDINLSASKSSFLFWCSVLMIKFSGSETAFFVLQKCSYLLTSYSSLLR